MPIVGLKGLQFSIAHVPSIATGPSLCPVPLGTHGFQPSNLCLIHGRRLAIFEGLVPGSLRSHPTSQFWIFLGICLPQNGQDEKPSSNRCGATNFDTYFVLCRNITMPIGCLKGLQFSIARLPSGAYGLAMATSSIFCLVPLETHGFQQSDLFVIHIRRSTIFKGLVHGTLRADPPSQIFIFLGCQCKHGIQRERAGSIDGAEFETRSLPDRLSERYNGHGRPDRPAIAHSAHSTAAGPAVPRQSQQPPAPATWLHSRIGGSYVLC
jgi:hypothetical protein